MSTLTSAVHVPLEVYLETIYRPDRDWIDGELKERNMCEMPHATLQGYFIRHLGNHAKQWSIRVLPEQRVQTSQKNYRIADVAVVRRNAPFELIVRTPPLLCIEVLSRDDTMSEMQERVDDYLGMGVQAVWVVDPRRRRAFSTDSPGAMQPQILQLTVEGTPIAISVFDLFAELDEAQAAASK
jgi:Uma2 family endonuclease